MNFGKNIKIITSSDIKNLNFLVKYRKVINHKILGKYLIDYKKSNILHKNYENNWVDQIIYYTNNEKTHIFFRNNFVIDMLLINKKDYKIEIIDIVNKVKQIISSKKLRLSIENIFYFLKLNIEKFDIITLNKLKTSLIEFSLFNDEISFYIKNNLFLTCKKEEIYNYLNNIIYEKYLNVYNLKTKIAFCTQDHTLFNSESSIFELTKFLFKKGYWLDFICLHSNKSFYNINNKKLIHSNHCHLLLKYDILIYLDSAILHIVNSNTLCIPDNKLIIVLPIGYSFDKQKIYNIKKKNIIYYGNRNIDKKHSSFLSFWSCKSIDNFLTSLQNYRNNFITFNTDVFNYDIKNDNTFLNRNDFFKIYNLDSRKKLITIFLEWPKILYSEFMGTSKWQTLNNKITPHGEIGKIVCFTEGYILFDSFFEKLNKIILCMEKNNCNVVFKIHPTSNIFIDNDKMYIVDTYINEKDKNDGQLLFPQFKHGYDIYLDKEKFGIKNLINNYKFFDNSFQKEILEYTDYGIIFSPTTCSWYNYLNNIPFLAISSKKYDWFKYMFSNDEYLNYRKKVIKEKNIDVKEDDLFCVGDLFYGDKVYLEDLVKNTDSIIKNFLNIDYKKSYKYFDNHPMYGNTYTNTQEKMADKIIEIINTIGYKDTSKCVNMIVGETFMTVYCKNSINVNIIDEEVKISIIDKPSKSYGVHFTTMYYIDNPNVTLEFECKLKKLEQEDVNVKVYTGIKWITLNTKLNTNYNKFSINDTFDFKSISKWRLSTTSMLENQEIYFKNIKFLT